MAATAIEALAKDKSSVAVGVSVGERSASGVTFAYSRRHNSGWAWGTSVSVGGPGYGRPYGYGHYRHDYGHHPRRYPHYYGQYYYGYPGSYAQLGYTRYSRGGSNWSVGYTYASPGYYGSYSRGYPAYPRGNPAYYGAAGYYDSRPRVDLGYAWGGRHSAYGVGVSIPLGDGGKGRPSMSDRIARGQAVENNPTQTRVWVPGGYVERAPANGQSQGGKVWAPGHWEYVSDEAR